MTHIRAIRREGRTGCGWRARLAGTFACPRGCKVGTGTKHPSKTKHRTLNFKRFAQLSAPETSNIPDPEPWPRCSSRLCPGRSHPAHRRKSSLGLAVSWSRGLAVSGCVGFGGSGGSGGSGGFGGLGPSGCSPFLSWGSKAPSACARFEASFGGSWMGSLRVGLFGLLWERSWRAPS